MYRYMYVMKKKQKCQQCGGNKKFPFWFGHEKDDQFCSPDCQDKNDDR